MKYHTNPERSGHTQLAEQQLTIESISFLKEMVNSLPFMVLLLNSRREIIFSNERILNKTGVKDIHDFFGKRPGEALNCIHLSDATEGCGTSEKCHLCGALNSILQSKEEQREVNREFRLVTMNAGVETWHDFRATSKPFRFNGQDFFLFTLEDTSHEKRRQALERIFFHDILNTAGNLRGISELLISSRPGTRKDELIKIMHDLTSELVDEIEEQKQLLAAETGQLNLNETRISSSDLLISLIEQFENNPCRKSEIIICDDSQDFTFKSDRGLVSRVIKNMVKNALEASTSADVVELCAIREKGCVRFQVKNPAFIPKNISYQIFKRSFSTKSADRGLGTYGMKMLGERYLRGKVWFTTSEDSGTSFFLELPVR